MLAMLRKDCWVMGKYTAVFLIAWASIGGTTAALLPEAGSIYYLLPVMASTIVLNAVRSDEASRWDRFAAMTPLRPWQIVLAKYVFAYGILALMTGLSALAALVTGPGGTDLWLMAVLVLLLVAMKLPLVYRFGHQKGGLMLLVLWGLIAAAVFGAAYWDYALLEAVFGWVEGVRSGVLALGVGGALAAINAGSILLSIRLYSRRQKGWYD